MTALISVAIECDRCKRRSGTARRAAYIARAALSRSGWHRYNGVDLCNDCWEAGVRGPKTMGQWARRRRIA